jgi:hypothetical protein
LYENRLIFIDKEDLEHPKTKVLASILQNFKTSRLLFLTPMKPCENFLKAVSNIPNAKVINPRDFNVKDAVKHDFTIITKQALSELELIIDSRDKEAYRNKSLPRPSLPMDQLLGYTPGEKIDFFDQVRKEVEGYDFNPDTGVEVYSKSLQGYLEKAQEYAKHKAEIQDSPDIMWVNKSQ